MDKHKSGRQLRASVGLRRLSDSSNKSKREFPIITPLIALQSPIFPKFNHWVSISNEALAETIVNAYQSGPQHVACFSQREIDDKAHVTDLSKIYHIGTLARITKFVSLSRTDIRMVISGMKRIKIGTHALFDHGVKFHRKTPEFDKYPNYIHDNTTNFDYQNPSVEDILKRNELKTDKDLRNKVVSKIGIVDYFSHLHPSDEGRATVILFLLFYFLYSLIFIITI